MTHKGTSSVLLLPRDVPPLHTPDEPDTELNDAE